MPTNPTDDLTQRAREFADRREEDARAYLEDGFKFRASLAQECADLLRALIEEREKLLGMLAECVMDHRTLTPDEEQYASTLVPTLIPKEPTDGEVRKLPHCICERCRRPFTATGRGCPHCDKEPTDGTL